MKRAMLMLTMAALLAAWPCVAEEEQQGESVLEAVEKQFESMREWVGERVEQIRGQDCEPEALGKTLVLEFGASQAEETVSVVTATTDFFLEFSRHGKAEDAEGQMHEHEAVKIEGTIEPSDMSGTYLLTCRGGVARERHGESEEGGQSEEDVAEFGASTLIRLGETKALAKRGALSFTVTLQRGE